jgi:hypothetical protein
MWRVEKLLLSKGSVTSLNVDTKVCDRFCTWIKPSTIRLISIIVDAITC